MFQIKIFVRLFLISGSVVFALANVLVAGGGGGLGGGHGSNDRWALCGEAAALETAFVEEVMPSLLDTSRRPIGIATDGTLLRMLTPEELASLPPGTVVQVPAGNKYVVRPGFGADEDVKGGVTQMSLRIRRANYDRIKRENVSHVDSNSALGESVVGEAIRNLAVRPTEELFDFVRRYPVGSRLQVAYRGAGTETVTIDGTIEGHFMDGVYLKDNQGAEHSVSFSERCFYANEKVVDYEYRPNQTSVEKITLHK